jgi:hypothetical protein
VVLSFLKGIAATSAPVSYCVDPGPETHRDTDYNDAGVVWIPDTVEQNGVVFARRSLRKAFERRVLEHQLPFAAVVGEADGDHTPGLDARHDTFPERGVANRVPRLQ